MGTFTDTESFYWDMTANILVAEGKAEDAIATLSECKFRFKSPAYSGLKIPSPFQSVFA
jgi:hypothetical protein